MPDSRRAEAAQACVVFGGDGSRLLEVSPSPKWREQSDGHELVVVEVTDTRVVVMPVEDDRIYQHVTCKGRWHIERIRSG